MPVYLRRFYYDKLVETKKEEKKKMDDHNKKAKRPSFNKPSMSRFKR
jgi:hypothetical protein